MWSESFNFVFEFLFVDNNKWWFNLIINGGFFVRFLVGNGVECLENCVVVW